MDWRRARGEAGSPVEVRQLLQEHPGGMDEGPWPRQWGWREAGQLKGREKLTGFIRHNVAKQKDPRLWGLTELVWNPDSTSYTNCFISLNFSFPVSKAWMISLSLDNTVSRGGNSSVFGTSGGTQVMLSLW